VRSILGYIPLDEKQEQSWFRERLKQAQNPSNERGRYCRQERWASPGSAISLHMTQSEYLPLSDPRALYSSYANNLGLLPRLIT